jgi:Ca2+-binding RTX toxin-like protein
MFGFSSGSKAADRLKQKRIDFTPNRRVEMNWNTQQKNRRTMLGLSSLEAREVPAVLAFFVPSINALSVFGDSQDNNITLSRDTSGKILVNGGAVNIFGGTPTATNTTSVHVFGQAGNDTITFNETNGVLPKANVFGGTGNDTITTGSGADFVFGQAGDDTILSKAGDDFVFGGAGDDLLIAGVGTDQVFGEAGNDRMIWNPGEGTDLNEGGAGIDTVEVNGGNVGENYTIAPNGTRVRLDRVSPAPFSMDIGTSENLVLNTNGGDDTVTAANGLAALINITIDGGAGNDNITSGDGNDKIFGGDGNDTINGGRGTDVVFMGAGDDLFIWNPGEGSDVVEGQDGKDLMVFNGAAANENFVLSANAGRTLLTRNVGNIVMDLNDVEVIDLNTLAGADSVVVNDTTGTDLAVFNVNLAGTSGADGQPDVITVNGTSGKDNITIVGAAGVATVSGLFTNVNISNSEAANDSLVVNGLAGDDSINASTLLGSRGVDLMIGGDGNDFMDGQQGNDVAMMGAGDDTFQWDPGDGSDVVEGQDGVDIMVFNGANVSENVDISANGSRAKFFRNVANITMDTDDVETFTFNALGGADNIVINDMSGTDVTTINLNLAAAGGAADGAADTITVNGTANDDVALITGNASGVSVLGLPVMVNITGSEIANDKLIVNALAGDDVIDASGLQAGAIQLTEDGGSGNDVLIGSDDADNLLGGDGDDVLIGGPAIDLLDGGTGDNVLIQ